MKKATQSVFSSVFGHTLGDVHVFIFREQDLNRLPHAQLKLVNRSTHLQIYQLIIWIQVSTQDYTT